MNCERCNRHVERIKRVTLTFSEHEGIRTSEWHKSLGYALCSDCAFEMKRKLGMYSTRRDSKEFAR